MIETNTRDLFISRESLRQANQFQENILRAMASALVVLDTEGVILQANEAALDMLGYSAEELLGLQIEEVAQLPGSGSQGSYAVGDADIDVRLADGEIVPTHFSTSVMRQASGESDGYVCVWVDLREKKQLEIELRHAQKLESLGQMAAGVAHEINTPIQYVGDSLHFLHEAFTDIQGLLQGYREASDKWKESPEFGKLHENLTELEEEADASFIEEEAPGAFERATNGLACVAKIVKALKSFSHPGSDTMAPAQINDVVETTLTLASNECKYIADVEVKLGDLPEIPCHVGDMGQVILNLVVNAAHAIEEKNEGTEDRGTIRIVTSCGETSIVVEISDSGAGIPDEVLGRIFDPFFTTKTVGKGTGQGLSIARRIVVDKHGGQLQVETQPGEGTTFRIVLPRKAMAKAA